MKVDIKVSADIDKPYAVIYTNSITREIERASSVLSSSLERDFITADDNEKIIIIKPEKVYMVRIENGDAVIYCKNKQYRSRKRLYEILQQLGNDFMQISKSSIINLKMLDSVEASFSGMMKLRLTNGCTDFISRKYLADFKKYLGI